MSLAIFAYTRNQTFTLVRDLNRFVLEQERVTTWSKYKFWSSEAMILAVVNTILAIAKRSLKNLGLHFISAVPYMIHFIHHFVHYKCQYYISAGETKPCILYTRRKLVLPAKIWRQYFYLLHVVSACLLFYITVILKSECIYSIPMLFNTHTQK